MPNVPNTGSSSEQGGDSEDMKYFRSSVPGLDVVVGDPDPTKGEVAPKTLQFIPYWEEKRGVEGRFKVGYLKTDDGSALRKLEEAGYVTEITADEYKEATEPRYEGSGKDKVQISGLRAPY